MVMMLPPRFTFDVAVASELADGAGRRRQRVVGMVLFGCRIMWHLGLLCEVRGRGVLSSYVCLIQ